MGRLLGEQEQQAGAEEILGLATIATALAGNVVGLAGTSATGHLGADTSNPNRAGLGYAYRICNRPVKLYVRYI
jgi:hypothetical protein